MFGRREYSETRERCRRCGRIWAARSHCVCWWTGEETAGDPVIVMWREGWLDLLWQWCEAALSRRRA